MPAVRPAALGAETRLSQQWHGFLAGPVERADHAQNFAALRVIEDGCRQLPADGETDRIFRIVPVLRRRNFAFGQELRRHCGVAQILVGGATAGPLVKVSDKVYTMLVTPPAGTTGLALIQVNAGAVQAAVGGTSSAYDAARVVFYRTP